MPSDAKITREKKNPNEKKLIKFDEIELIASELLFAKRKKKAKTMVFNKWETRRASQFVYIIILFKS